MSSMRIETERPIGCRFFEDVKSPRGWEWSEKKWALDLWSREWVEERIITGVEVETEGERWVYDIRYEGQEEDPVGVMDTGSSSNVGSVRGKKGVPVSWEEASEVDGAVGGENGEGEDGFEWLRESGKIMKRRSKMRRNS